MERNRNQDNPRAVVLEQARTIERRLAALLPRTGGALATAGADQRLSAAVRADLVWMADLVSEIERGMNPTANDAKAFCEAAGRVADALGAMAERSWRARAERFYVRVLRLGLTTGIAGLLLASGLLLGMFLLTEAPPLYMDFMRVSAIVGGASLLAVLGLDLLRGLLGRLAKAARWVAHHPVRAAVGVIGVPLLAALLFPFVGVVGLLVLGGCLLLLSSWNFKPGQTTPWNSQPMGDPSDFDPAVPSLASPDPIFAESVKPRHHDDSD